MWRVYVKSCILRYGFLYCWISLRNIVEDLQKTQVEYCWIDRSLHFGISFLFLQLEGWSIVFVSETFRFNAHCVDAWISREEKYHKRRKAMDLMVWKKEKIKKIKKIKPRRESYRGNEEREKNPKKKKSKVEECYIIWRRTTWRVIIDWRNVSSGPNLISITYLLLNKITIFP